MVWNTLIIVTVLLPIAGFAIDVPRYVMLRSRLQIACDAAAEAAARQVDTAYYTTTGETRLNPTTYAGEAQWAFAQAVAGLAAKGYTASMTGLALDEAADAVQVDAAGSLRLFFYLTPPVTVRTTATSWYRMVRR